MSKIKRKNLAVLADDHLSSATANQNNVIPPWNESTNKLIKRKLMHDNPGSEMDRYMIALLNLQTKGRVELRRLTGMHGGGFGTKQDQEQIEIWKQNGKSNQTRPLMKVKADLDKERIILEDWDSDHNGQDSVQHGKVMWPSKQTNVTPQEVEGDDEYLAHIFCWHGQSPFLVWHRPLMKEFELLLQKYDPLFPGLHEGNDALGAHYYDWDGWDGMRLPAFINYPTYKLKSRVFEAWVAENAMYDSFEEQASQSHIITNPLYRWFAPMLPEHQLNETFPSETPQDDNCSTRDGGYSDNSGFTPYAHSWPKNDAKGNPSISTSIREAMRESDILAFCTTTHNGNQSIEHAHNLFHNRIGGDNGTMPSVQSSFDPIFWLHHSNVERQLLSWQKVWSRIGRTESIPPKWLMETRLYPWTKPNLLKEGKLSWNTAADVDQNGDAAQTTTNDGTVQDWWDYKQLDYEYDEYIPVTRPLIGGGFFPLFGSEKILATMWIPVLDSGDFELYVRGGDGEEEIIDSVSLINGNVDTNSSATNDDTRTSCAQCMKRKHLTLVYDVTGFVTPSDFANYKRGYPPKEGASRVVEKLFVRHKGEDYLVDTDDATKKVIVKSVKGARSHKQKIRKTLMLLSKKLLNDAGKKGGFKWDCRGGGEGDIVGEPQN